MEIVQAVKKLNSISRERLNFRTRPILCTTLYRNPMQASNFGGTFDQLFLRFFFIKFSQKMPLYLFYTMVQKSQKRPKKLKSRGGGVLTSHVDLQTYICSHSTGDSFRLLGFHQCSAGIVAGSSKELMPGLHAQHLSDKCESPTPCRECPTLPTTVYFFGYANEILMQSCMTATHITQLLMIYSWFHKLEVACICESLPLKTWEKRNSGKG